MKTTRITILALIVLTLLSCAPLRTGYILEGTVTDSGGAPLSGVRISIEGASGADTETDGSEAEGRPRRRRRGRRGRRGRGPGNKLEGTFDHGDEGFGLWLDPAIQDIQAYSENWAGKRDVTVTVEADQIIIRRAGEPADES